MRQAVHIFLKDSRQFRWPIAVLLVWTAVLMPYGAVPWATDGPEALGLLGAGSWALNRELGSLILIGAWWVLIALVVQAESLPGDRQFWLTRPYGRRQLASAKALFVGIYFLLPIFVTHGLAVLRNGVPLWPSLPLLLWNELLLIAALVLPPAAIAAVTSSLPQLVFGLVVVVPMAYPMVYERWGNLEWIRQGIWTAALGVISASVLTTQFRTRRTTAARVLAVAGVLTVVVMMYFAPWRWGSAVQALLTGSGSGRLTATLMASAEQPPLTAKDKAMRSRLRLDPGLELNYRLAGLADGTPVVCDAMEFRIEAANGRSWSSQTISSARADFDPMPSMCSARMSVPPSFVDAITDEHITVHAVLYVTGLSLEKDVELRVAPARTPFGGSRVCSAGEAANLFAEPDDRTPPGPQVAVECRATLLSTYPLVESASTTAAFPTLRGIDYAPVPTLFTLVPVQRTFTVESGLPNHVRVSAWKPLTHQRIEVPAQQIRLSDWAR